MMLLLIGISSITNAQTCYGPYNPTPASVWGIAEKFASNAVIWNGSTPTAADMDGDGISELIVTAADCNGAIEYNEDLSIRRAKRISKSLAKLSNNILIIKQVGERELLKDCSEARKDILEQVVNRYSYIFILNE